MRIIKMPVYKLQELEEKAKDKAIQSHIDFVTSTFYNNEGIEEQTYRDNFNEKQAIEEINMNEYEFFADGELIPIEYYS